MKYCSRCGKELEDDALVCSECGKRQYKGNFIALIISLIGLFLVIIGVHYIINIISIVCGIVSIVLTFIKKDPLNMKWSLGLGIFSIIGSIILLIFNFI